MSADGFAGCANDVAASGARPFGKGGAELAAGVDTAGDTSAVLVECGCDIGSSRAVTQGQDADGAGIFCGANVLPRCADDDSLAIGRNSDSGAETITWLLPTGWKVALQLLLDSPGLLVVMKISSLPQMIMPASLIEPMSSPGAPTAISW